MAITGDDMLEVIKQRADNDAKVMEAMSREELIWLLAEARANLAFIANFLPHLTDIIKAGQLLQVATVGAVNGMIENKPVKPLDVNDFLDFGKEDTKSDIS